MDVDSLKTYLFTEFEQELKQKGLNIVDQDQSRPWGGFFVIDEAQSTEFAQHYFAGLSLDELKIYGKLSPKLLFVAPQQRLSWQYHYRRAEIWKVIKGPVGVVKSLTDEEGPLEMMHAGELIRLQQGERHRLVGLGSWGILAEIWQHINPDEPSDENDIIRIQDDFGR